jgi:hypothetical protein
MVRALPVDQAAAMLSAFGQSTGDQFRTSALAKQLGDKEGALGRAMMYASAQTTQGRLTAQLVLLGDQAFKDKVVTVDKMAETGWQATIAKQIRGAYSNPEAESQYIQAAMEITAAKYAQNGSADVAEAVRLATGGIVERNGQKIPLPYGMSESEFDKRIGGVKSSDVVGQAPEGFVRVGATTMSVPEFVATLPQATLVHAGQGLYNVRAGTGLVTNAAGARITIKVAP